MNRLIVALSFLSIFFCIKPSNAIDEPWMNGAVQVKKDSPLQDDVDQALFQIFNSPMREVLCRVVDSPVSVFYSLGSSVKMAAEIGKVCEFTELDGPLSKNFRKEYYFSPIRDSALESWTDYINRTFIFVRPDYTTAELTQTLTHEVAITFDAKNRMRYVDYLRYQTISKSQNTRGAVSIHLGDLSEKEKSLQTAFDMATTTNVATTFAAMRAFQFEKYVAGDFTGVQHNACVDQFREIYEITKRFKVYSEGNKNDLSELAKREQWSQEGRKDEELVLKFLLNKDLQLEDRGQSISFCQYMTTPLITAKTYGSFFASGPRPRMTGGSGGQGSGDRLPMDNTFSKDQIKMARGKLLMDKDFQMKLKNILKFDSRESAKPLSFDSSTNQVNPFEFGNAANEQ